MDKNNTEKLTMDIPEAARALGISRATAYALVREGKLPAIRISERRVVIPKAALAKLLETTMKPLVSLG